MEIKWITYDEKVDHTNDDKDTIYLPIGKGVTLIGDAIYFGGKKLPDPPRGVSYVNIVNDRVYVNGYEYIDGKWKRTLSALWHKYF